MPPGYRYAYHDGWRGWPVSPVNQQHPIRGSLLDPRGPDNDGLSGYHFGVDVSVDDQHPEAGASKGLSHRVFALESGSAQPRPGSRPCGDRRIEIGHFTYWHVSPTVARGQQIRAGQQIGWTCIGEWHVHVSEWTRLGSKRVWVNPLHDGGKIAPYVDTTPPVVRELRFSAPAKPWDPEVSLSQPDTTARLDPRHLHGRVELRARVADRSSFGGFLTRDPRWPTELHPTSLAVAITSEASGQIVLHRVAFLADQLPTTPYLVHYAPGSTQNASMSECLGPPSLADCDGIFWLRPFSLFRQEYWDTRASPNGAYRVIVRVTDAIGNRAYGSATVKVAN